MSSQKTIEYGDAVFSGLFGGGYLGSVIGIGEIVLVILITCIELWSSQGFLTVLGTILALCAFVYFTAGVVAIIPGIIGIVAGAIMGGVAGLVSGIIGGIIYLILPKDAEGGSASATRFINACLSSIIFGGVAYVVSAFTWFEWTSMIAPDTDWAEPFVGWANVIAFTVVGWLLGCMIGQFNSAEMKEMTRNEDDESSGLGSPFVFCPMQRTWRIVLANQCSIRRMSYCLVRTHGSNRFVFCLVNQIEYT